MDAVLVSFENLLLGDVVRTFHLRAFSVALSAHQWDVEGRDGRTTVREGQNVVISVAILTMGRVFVAELPPLPVRAGPIRGERAVVIFVALFAVDAPKPRRMWVFLNLM